MSNKPLTAKQAIEVRRLWLDDQWKKKWPNGEWRVIRRTSRWNGEGLKPPITRVLLIHFTTRSHQSSCGRPDKWECMPTYDASVCWQKGKYPPEYGRMGGAQGYYSKSFFCERAARRKYQELCDALNP